MRSMTSTTALRGAAVIALAFVATHARADDYCCTCKGKPGKTISASDDFTAGAQCSMSCKRPTLPRAGACEPAPAPTAPATPAAAPSAPSGTLLLFASEDCSGDSTKVSGNAGSVAGGMRSFMVESGGAASAWQKADYTGAQVQPVAPGNCISPGWEIASVKFQGK